MLNISMIIWLLKEQYYSKLQLKVISYLKKTKMWKIETRWDHYKLLSKPK